MKTIARAILVTFLSLLLVFIILGTMFVYSLFSMEISSIYFDELEDIGTDGFTLSGYVELSNSGLLPVSVESVHYEVILEGVGETEPLMEKDIIGSTIFPRKTKRFPLSTTINWVPSIETVVTLLTSEKAYAIVKGYVYVIDLKVKEVKIEFEEKVDLREYLGQFALKTEKGTAEEMKGVLEGIAEKMEKGLESIAGELGGLIS